MALDPEHPRTYGLEPVLAWDRNKYHVKQSREYVLGPMPPMSFMEEFLPLGSSQRHGLLSPRNAFAAVPLSAETPAQVYEPLASALNKKTRHKARCPGFTFEKTIERSKRPERLGYAKPHISCFASGNLDIVRRADKGSRIDFGYAELFIQVASSPATDYFIDPKPYADIPTLIAHQFTRAFDDDEAYDQAERTWGLHIAFATEVFARQHRTFLFTVSVFGTFARLYRWDRSGCIITATFDIHEHSDIFSEFFWRFSQLSDAERGHDLTFQMSSETEERLFCDTVSAYVASQLDIAGEELEKALLAHYQPGHVTKVAVHAVVGEGRETRDLLVSRPVVSPLSLDGRCTRGFWAVDVKTSKVVFLKDTWRTPSQIETEGDVIGRLNELGVRNVPMVVCHGDVIVDGAIPADASAEPAFQETRTNEFTTEPWSRCIDEKDVYVSRRRHYRLVLGTVGYSIKMLRGTEELLHSTFDVFLAMKDAFEKGSRLHRDLSLGNIILVKDSDRPIRRGYLIDWDASDAVDETGKALHEGRAGTWLFMSIRVLDEREVNSKHTFPDDMESLLYVVFYCALCYLPHSLSDRDVTTVHREFFESVFNMKGVSGGGGAKMSNAINRIITKRIRWGSASFAEWFNTVLDYHHPPSTPIWERSDKWNAETLEAFWSHFLETHELERDNRVVHRISKASRYDRNSPDTPTPPLPSATPDPKRGRAESSPVLEDGREVKKGRFADEAGTPPARAIASADPVSARKPGSPSSRRSGKDRFPGPSTSTPRRSERIRDRQSKASPAAPTAPRTLRVTSRRAARGRTRTSSRK
ncbi:hypothetical protein NUW54_g3930 [Trametes sanguinea]|uniref:Uncharacterized protein n=1 Tax=Trametes sanguinea TaxID=158606 RepID=A0ACC1PZC8_9APHY|nr:hypothetical protein NUW54_g3930 [Trametes sanguinea]